MIRVLLATTWGTPCGIAEHSRLLHEYVQRADRGVEILPSVVALDPDALGVEITGRVDLVHLNHHDALHSRWTPEAVERVVARGTPVVVTYHDTRARLEECPKLRGMAEVASAVVIHEPVEGLEGPRIFYWRQGVPDAARAPMEYAHHEKAYAQQPLIGTVGFNFPWKNYDRLAELTGQRGWALLILSCNATEADTARWQTRNPDTRVVAGFIPTTEVIARLAGCDASVFAYECANTGTSGAIRLGIAARKPVIAFTGCRQFRDLQLDADNRFAIRWVDDWPGLARQLIYYTGSGRYDSRVVALAQRESWQALGRRYATLYHSLVEETVPGGVS